MSETRVKLNHAGFRELLHSAELTEGLAEIARGVADRAGDGYASDTYDAGSRVVASAYTDTVPAMRESARLSGDPLLEAMQA